MFKSSSFAPVLFEGKNTYTTLKGEKTIGRRHFAVSGDLISGQFHLLQHYRAAVEKTVKLRKKGARRGVLVMGSRLHIEGDESVMLLVTHSNIKSFTADVRFSLQSTVESVKEKLWKKCGTSVDSMSLELYDDTGKKTAELGDNSRRLGFYSPHEGYRLHVIDLDPSSVTSGGWLEDTSLVEKYQIPEERYDKLDEYEHIDIDCLPWPLNRTLQSSVYSLLVQSWVDVERFR
ncbi:Tubulin-folding cofactor B-like protein [Drosera capensis]